ncbi:phosphate ABC transporter permease protein PstC [Gottschalkia acidurici 9a]|uniref:Phosphate transport system permease protein n=1 Tax=Gottschalkia acidurici (strain ATCC 7906 / DSM 604 / BCRC 14475 / CIP 104303 / KCTC 5404 / NCIMB 10678 / 9a) TaxID=1128398 RepID=K0AZM0_GOTA9|nr:phosphate ABC transporter permease subunit PstC [Gottschalkia acidurici]AFS78719.1 phosphate ABC transporter permease protein PstC [Gottschalkia acidurici 9a]
MQNMKENIFKYIIRLLTLISLLILVFIIIFIFKESFKFFKEVSILRFITGETWNPLGSPEKLSILPTILGTLYVSLVAITIALPIGIGSSIVISSYIGGSGKIFINLLLDILVGIPSVVYGFIGLIVLVKFLETNFSFSSGESILAGGILLSIMIIPYIISTCSESMNKINKKYSKDSSVLGVSKSYMLRKILIPQSKKSIVAGAVLALSRAMGETMAVMMVIGNAPIIPRLLGKGQTIPSLIALEMGMAEVGSLHYHALFASGFILMIILIIINMIFYSIRKNIDI